MKCVFKATLFWALALLLLPQATSAAGRHALRTSGVPVHQVTQVARTAPMRSNALPAPSSSRAELLTLLAQINRDRIALHAPAITLSGRQSRCSRAHSRHMAALNAITHDEFPSDVCIRHLTAGENVGVASGDALQAMTTLHQMMMAEGPCTRRRCSAAELEQHAHYLNLTNPAFRHVGLGVYSAGGQTWLTEDFTD